MNVFCFHQNLSFPVKKTSANRGFFLADKTAAVSAKLISWTLCINLSFFRNMWSFQYFLLKSFECFLLSSKSFISCQKDIGKLRIFFWQTRQQQFRLSWSSQGSNAFCTTTISREKNFFLFLTFCSWFFKTYWTVFLKISALYSRPDKS